MIAAMALLSMKDGIAKVFVRDISAFQVIWVQYACTFAVVALIAVPRYGWRVFLPTPLGWQIVRGIAGISAVGTYYLSLSFIPLADATAMALFAPIIVTLLSPYLLGEQVGIRRQIAIAVGFIGVVIILRPGFAGSSIGYYIGLLGGFIMGLYFIGNRKISASHPPLINVAHNVLIGAVAAAPVIPFIWVDPPSPNATSYLVFLALAISGQGLMLTAFRHAPAGVIAAFNYTLIVFATLIGYFVFGTFPDPVTWVGIALIVLAGLFIALRENALNTAAADKTHR